MQKINSVRYGGSKIMKEKNKELEVIYIESSDISEEEKERRLSEVFDILFDEK